MAASYDDGKISLVANEVAEAIKQASLGRVPWTLFGGRRQGLVGIKQLTRPPLGSYLTVLAELYDLTGAESRLCLCLYEGRNPQEAAVELGIGYGTVRARLKSIFAKTSTHSQPELCALLARYAG